MRSITLFLFTFIFALALSPVHAAQYYRHIPFSLSIGAKDKLTVDYDFSEKKGIHCTSTSNRLVIRFEYKGNKKSWSLPVDLESDHVPQNHPGRIPEQLADVQGQFTIEFDHKSFPHPSDDETFHVTCSFIQGHAVE